MNSFASRHIAWLAAAILCMAAACGLSGCNAQKKNTAAARQYTAFITRYNIHYNGETHFKETLADMEQKYEDDYSQMVYMHPIESKADPKAPQASGNFDRSIEKAQKAIQIRSIKKKPQRKPGRGSDPAYKAWLKRDEYNPFLHNSWMLMGRSQYFNGDFLGAASTFFYVSKHFSWLPNTVLEAKLWQARSYLAMDWLYEAEVIITRIKPDELATSGLRQLYNFCYADFLVRSKEYASAVPYLQKAIDGAGGAQKTRLRFLLGQIYSFLGEKRLAYEAFKKAGASSSASYRTKFNARIKQSEVFEGADISGEVKALRRMAKYDRNKDFLDQIYYAIGNLYLSRGDTASAIENYAQAVAKSTRGGIEKAIAQITLGNLYFDRREYAKAQPCYSEAVPLLPENYPDYKLLKRRSDVLDELAVYSQNVSMQDSLLRVAALPEAEQLAIIDRQIKELKEREKKEAEERDREEYLAQQEASSNMLSDQGQREYQINTDDSWYFYNSTTRNSGKTEFQRRWGSRKLEDDWRRRNKSTFNTSDFDATDESEGDDDENSEASEEPQDQADAEEQAAKTEAASDPHNREYYLAQLPVTEEQKALAHEVIQDGLYNMGIILKDKLDDYPAALAEFDRLLREYPDNIYRLDIYYNLYLMYMRKGEEAMAEKYRQLILSDFPESPYALALANPNYIEDLRQMDTRQQELYDATYEAYLDNRNGEVHRAYAEMMDKYPLSPIMPKFMFLDALSYATERDTEKFNAVLRDLLDRYPDTDITPIASAWLTGMAQGRQIQSQSEGNLRGMLWDIRLSADSASMAADSIAAAFELNEDAPQLLVMVYPTDSVSANALLYEVARFNFNSFVVKDFDLETMNFGRLGMLIIRGFDNQRELNHYRSVMAASPLFKLPPGVRPIAISAKNFDTLLQHGRTFEDYFRFLEEQNYVDAQADLLKAEEIETLQEAEEAEAVRQAEGVGPEAAEGPQAPN
ncbi:MAG: hypothetical protein NC102_06220, partial [Clostridium sp.]|nr:hypothetical protein [Clostridium sp.]